MILLYIFLLPTLIARAEVALSLKVEDQTIEFVEFKKRRLTISKGCLIKDRLSCEAYRTFEKAPQMAVTQSSPPEIGKEICKLFQGVIVLGTDAKGDQMAICKFKKDLSFIDLGSLYASHSKLAL